MIPLKRGNLHPPKEGALFKRPNPTPEIRRSILKKLEVRTSQLCMNGELSVIRK
jgi:hypothetical protein